MRSKKKHRIQHWRASLIEAALLLREFRGPVIIFAVALLGGGSLYDLTAKSVGEPVGSLAESFYTVLTMAFLQPVGDFPRHPLLQIFYFIMPLVGLGALAQGLTDFGILLFNRRARTREWETAVASTLNKHHILVGLGHLGYRVVQQLHEMGERVAVIELNPKADLSAAVRKIHVPVINGDASREVVLEDANVGKAKSIILCTQDDTLNLKTALKARSLNPNIQVVIRIFDDDFADELQHQFKFNALSGTGIAAPAFAAAAAGADITNPIQVEGESLSLARLTVQPESDLEGKTVGQVEDGYVVSIILIRQDHATNFHPTDSTPLHAGNILAVLGRPDRLNTLVHASH
ncbi:MAG: potassium channel family protein [Chloroflexota bacterium]